MIGGARLAHLPDGSDTEFTFQFVAANSGLPAIVPGVFSVRYEKQLDPPSSLSVAFELLGVVAAPFYQRHLGFMLAPDLRWVRAILFYTIFIVGLLVFIVLPGLAAGSLPRALMLAALLGFMRYATLDMTCLALFKEFPVIVDLIRVSALSATVTTAG